MERTFFVWKLHLGIPKLAFHLHSNQNFRIFLVNGKPPSSFRITFLARPIPRSVSSSHMAVEHQSKDYSSLAHPNTLSHATQATAKGTHHGIISNKLSSLFCSRPQNHLSASKEWLWNELMNNKRVILRRGFPRGICVFQHAWGMKEIWKSNILKQQRCTF